MLRAFLATVALQASALAGLPEDVERYLLAAEEVVVTATRDEIDPHEAPYTTNTVDGERLVGHSYRTTPQIVRDTPGVFVQETAPGQGSPYLRGFTGFRTLMLIDGIRLNNSVFREGPNQYWSTIDPFCIERLEVVLGPSSVLHGSDAIGGTVQVFTRGPTAYGEGGWHTGGRVAARYGSGESSVAGRGEIDVAHGERTGFYAGLTGNRFGSVEAGDPMGKQPGTGYDEWAGDVKVEHFLDPDSRIIVAYQHVDQNNVPRTHSTVDAKSFYGTDVGSELRRDHDQERWLVYTQFLKENIGDAIESVHASLSWHSQSELRDRLRTGDRRDFQGHDVGTLGFFVTANSSTAYGRFTYGVEYYRDFVSSFNSGNPIQGPVGDDARYDLLSGFIQDVIKVRDRWEFIVGIRFTYAAASADSVLDPATGGRISVSDNWTAIVGSLRALYHLAPDRWNLFAGVSQGFRAPNLSDLTRFDNARTNEFEIPAPGLDPEDYVSFELGVKGRGETHIVRVSGFYTLIRDQIVRFPTGETNGDGDFLITRANVGDGYVLGVELFASWTFAPRWTAFVLGAYQYGKVDTFPTSDPVIVREYIDRLMPLSGQVGVRWQEDASRFWAEVAVVLVDKADKLSTRDASDTQRIPPGGTPGYGVVHVRGGWNIDPRTHLVLAVENLLDKSYRVHGSGSNMPGLNVIVTFVKDF
jgi:hemoglobin/transferrin/lactoferrin receptor protein